VYNTETNIWFERRKYEKMVKNEKNEGAY
jgi:hypothetical protein